MELLLAVLIWIGAISSDEAPYISDTEATEIFQINADQIEAEYPDEFSIIMIDENEVN